MKSKKAFTSADFNGDEASLPGCPEHFKSGLIVNPEADCVELLSGAVHRLGNALDVFWLCLERANAAGDDPLEGALVSIARLCTEARALNQVAIEQCVKTGYSGRMAKVKEVPG